MRNNRISDGDDNIGGSSDHLATGEVTVLRVLLAIAIGVFIYANPEARQITADLLRATGDAIAPADESKTLRERLTDLIGGD